MTLSNIVIRDFDSADYMAISKLWEETGLGGSFRGDNLGVIERTLLIGGKLLVAEIPGTKEIIGTSWLTLDGRRFYLHHFGVHKGFRKKGLAKKMLEESLSFAREKGIQIKLEVHRNNKEAVSLYKKYGFSYLGDYDVYIIRDYN